MSSRTVTIDRRMPDGTISPLTRTFYFSAHGAVIARPEAGMNWTRSSAYVLADPNRHNTRLMEQWIGIGTASDVPALKAALDRVVGLPWVNTVAADRQRQYPVRGRQRGADGKCGCVHARVPAGAGAAHL